MSFLAKADALIAGRYRLRRPIGEGGMGGVWEATDQVLGCPIALKVVPDKHLTGDRTQQIQRFLREARLAAQVQHPSVVRVTDFGVHEDTPYIAMELLEGESLADRMCREPALEIDEAVQICIGILRGLCAAHAADVVHRDIKPENVQLVSTVEGLYPKLIDFGISLGTDQNNNRVSAVTTNGHVFGTPLYMSPEHARGLRIDGRADLYSLGVVLYEMVARQPPFTAESAVDMMASIVRDTPDAPRTVRPVVSQELSDVIMKAMSKEPDDRFSCASEMAQALAAAAPSVRADSTGPVTRSGVHRIREDLPSTLPPSELYAVPLKRRYVVASLSLMALIVAVWLLVDFQDDPSPTLEVETESIETMRSVEDIRSVPVAEPGELEEGPEVTTPEEGLPQALEPASEEDEQVPADDAAEATPRVVRSPPRRTRSRMSQISQMSQMEETTRMSFRQLDY